MKIFLIDNNQIIKYMLPLKVDDSFLINYNSSTFKSIVSFVGVNNRWYLKSNGNTNIIEDNEEIDSVLIEPYCKYTLKVVGKSKTLEVFVLPIKEKLFRLDFRGLNSFSVGRKETCSIFYNSNEVAEIEATFKIINNEWYVTSVSDDNYKVFVNNFKENIKKLKSGDIIFLGGIKIVWMQSYIYINNPKNSLKITGMRLVADASDNPLEFDPVSEEDKHVELYKKENYFVHYPIIREKVVNEEFTVEAPPNEEKDNSMPFILTMGTSLIMMSSSFMMLFNVSYGLNQGRDMMQMIPQIVMCVCMILGSLVFPRITRAYQKHKLKKREKLRKEKYGEYLTEKDRELTIKVKNQLRVLNENYLNSDNCLIALQKKNRNFWWCQYNDDEFLSIRVGIGRKNFNVAVKAPEKHFTLEEDELFNNSCAIKDKYKYVDGAPITVSLKNSNVTSLICKTINRVKFVNELITQLIITHSSIDLKIALFTKNENIQRWDFIKYIPHIFTDEKDIRLFASNDNEAKYVSNYLEEIIKFRKEQKEESNNKDVVPMPYFLVITDDYSNKRNIGFFEDFINKDLNSLGFSLLVIDDDLKNVPSSSNTFIEVREKDGVILERQTGLNEQTIFYIEKQKNDLDMDAIAFNLANIPVMTKDGASVLPKSLDFLDMFNVSKIEQLNILNRWKINNPVLSLDTVVGVHPNGEDFKLDLHEKFHGPHGLIAGSTGSGKSEFIITYILSMAINYHPYEVQFVLIDYKGGGLAGAFENKESGVKIPHLAGTITNLDNHELNRSLISIQSELTRRQKIFNDTRERLKEGTIDIYKYQKLFREGIVNKPLSHLFIICDEFAELKQQQPDFMQQLISTSRIGRSLGVHLILATQKPSGIVNDQIWANSRFKVCLKVQDKSDSMEMLKRPEAASIKETGRFYLQVGYDELFEIGQSGWSGAKYVPSDKILKKVDESINFINNVGYIIKSVKEEDKESIPKKDYGDQLTNIVRYISDLGKKEHITINKLWLDSIPEIIYVDDIKKKYNYKPVEYYINPVIGEYDDPINQTQGLLSIDLSKNGNLIVFGTPGSGKENLVVNMIRSIVMDHSPNEVNIYILDCGSELLKIFTNFPHVGEVVTIENNEKIQDLIKMISEEIEKRKSLFTDYAGDYNDYIKYSGKKMPLMLIFINNFDSFVESYDDESQEMTTLFRDGYKYGIVFVVTAISTSVIRSKTMAYFNNKICLQLSDETDYRMILNAPRQVLPAEYFGRGLVLIDNSAYEFQTGTYTKIQNYTSELRNLGLVLNEKYNTKVSKIPSVPDRVYVDMLYSYYKDFNSVPIGFNMKTKKVSCITKQNTKPYVISYTNLDDNKLSFLNALIKMMASKNMVYVLDFKSMIKKSFDNVEVMTNNFQNFINNYAGLDSWTIVLGVGAIKETFSNNDCNMITDFISKKCKNVIIFDNVDDINQIRMDISYDKNNALWLGEGINNQITIHAPNIGYNDKKIKFEHLAYKVSGESYEIIRYMLDSGDQNE